MNDINFINKKKDEFIHWFSRASVVDKYKASHAGFVVALENELIRANYIHMALAPLATVTMLPCLVIPGMTLGDYFQEKADVDIMEAYRLLLMEMMMSTSYKEELMRQAMKMASANKTK